MMDGKPLYPFSASVTVAAAANIVNSAQAPGRLWGYQLVNNTGALAYLQVFDLVLANVTLGTTVPNWVIPLAANAMVILPPISLITRHSVAFTIAGTTTRGGSTTAAIDVLLWLSN